MCGTRSVQPRLRLILRGRLLGETPGARLHVDLQRRQRAGLGLGLRADRAHLLAVPAGHRAGGGHDAAALAEGADRIVGLGQVAAVEADRAAVRRLRLRVEDHQRGRGGLAVGVLRVRVAPGQAGLGQQAGDEGPVGLAVLGGDRVRRQRGLHVEAERGLRIVGEDPFADRARVQVLEHQRVAPQLQQRRPRRQGQPVAGQAAVAAQLRHFGAQALPVALRAVGLAQLQVQWLLQQRLGIEKRRGGQARDLQHGGAAHRLLPVEAFHHQPLDRGAQLDQAGMLGRLRQTSQGDGQRRDIHIDVLTAE